MAPAPVRPAWREQQALLEWQGFPLRKDYDILQQDEAWVRENLGIESGQ